MAARSLRVEALAAPRVGAGVRRAALARWLVAAAPPRAAGEVTIYLTSDTHIRTLNRRYRRKDRVTDVLSFPASPKPQAARLKPQAARRLPLGDVVIAVGRARRQARAAGHALETELRVLALHGLLHLLGHDHETDGGEMARLERRLRRRAGLREGLTERGGAR
jgi:probable rRNA maturation factor